MDRFHTVRPIIACIAFVSCLVSRPTLAQRPEAILARAAERYRSAETVRASFEQTITNALTGSVLTARGELLHRRPNLLAINFTTPVSDRIVDDGQALWVYLPSSAPGQVIKMPTQQAQGELFDPLGQILSASVQSYTLVSSGAATIAGHATHAVTMTPKHEGRLFTKATVWVDDSTGVARQIEAAEPSGVTRRIVITAFVVDAPIPRSAFRFTLPPKVRVVDAPAS